MKQMQVTLQRWSKPNFKTIWQEIGKPSQFTITGISKVKEAWELPYWTVYFEVPDDVTYLGQVFIKS